METIIVGVVTFLCALFGSFSFLSIHETGDED